MQEERLYSYMVSSEMTWESLIRDIVKSEGMDPWNIDIAILTNRYMDFLKHAQEVDIRLSGKFILAAAILLKMKSDYLFVAEEENEEGDNLALSPEFLEDISKYNLQPHLPLPKRRKVSLDELLSSLKQAIVVEKRRDKRTSERDDIKMPAKLMRKIEIGRKIKEFYERVVDIFKSAKEITFNSLLNSKQRFDIVWTFIPMIHVANKGKISLRQDAPFGEIYIKEGENVDSTVESTAAEKKAYEQKDDDND